MHFSPLTLDGAVYHSSKYHLEYNLKYRKSLDFQIQWLVFGCLQIYIDMI